MNAASTTFRFDRAAIMREAWRQTHLRHGNVRAFGLRRVTRGEKRTLRAPDIPSDAPKRNAPHS